jgi:hypothetical protein
LARKVGDTMSMVLQISAESGFLRVQAMGEFSLVEAKRTFMEMLEAVPRNRVDKVLFDGRGLKGNPKFIERFYYAEFAAHAVATSPAHGAYPSTKYAYLLEVPIRDPGRFGEDVARNRGMNVKTFDNLEGALGWLGITPANKPDARAEINPGRENRGDSP